MSLHWLYFFQIFFAFSLLDLTLGHGFVHSVVVGGQTYPGWNPFSDPYTTSPAKVVRKVQSDGFVANTDPDIACHHGGNDGTAAIASASPGSQVKFQWEYWPGDHQGPVSTYMASCDGDCSKFSANEARWFKVDAEGYDSSSRQWAAAKLIANGASWTSTIPEGLAPGQYLIRSEIIALHSSAPQFYPSCSQIEVTGSGTGKPSDNELVSMQALYTGATFPNIYGDSVSFTIPGPPPVNFNGGGGGSVPSSTTASPTTVSPASTTSVGTKGATSTTASTPISQTTTRCKLGSKKLLKRRSMTIW